MAATTGGVLAGGADPAASVTGRVVHDSRAVGPGDLFVAIAGEHTDGHEHAAAAVAAGAVAVLAAREVGVPAVVVGDVLDGLGRLARGVLDRLPGVTVVGVTGSSGKTGTKDLLAALLGRLGETVAPVGSWNNEIGHPLTVLRLTPATRYLVAECSARGLGHIAALCRIAPPRIGVELNVGHAHVGEFGDRATTALAKRELVEALPADGLAVLNVDDDLVAAMAGSTAAAVTRVGLRPDADVRAQDVRLDGEGHPTFTLVAPQGRVPVRLALVGAHHVGNALAAAAVALACGLPPAQVAEVLATTGPVSPGRMAVHRRADGVTVVDDSYNANPESMAAGLRALAAIGAGRRRLAVLGGMAELGDRTAQEHARIGRLAVDLGVDELIVVGGLAGGLAEAARRAGGTVRTVPDAAAAAAAVTRAVRGDDVVLVKASHSVGLDAVAAALLADSAPADGAAR